MPAIKTHDLTKYYKNGKILGLKDLNLTIEEGEIFGFIGPNGAGKSTTIRLLLDFIRPTSGSATILGLDSFRDSVKIHETIGYLPGEIFLDENQTGKECLGYFKGFKKVIDEDYLDGLIKKLQLNLSVKVRDYSKGNKQKLAIILALMHKPRLLILDEPTSGLDPVNQHEFYKLIEETKKWGTTTFFSTHILEEAENICDRVGIIKDGVLLKIENVDEFKQKNIRDVHLKTKVNIPLEKLTMKNVKKAEKTTYGYHLTTIGENGDIIKALANFEINDFSISEPSLEEIFMHYYKEKNV